jgi:hypothetical protein
MKELKKKLVRPLIRRQNDNLAPKVAKVAHAWSKQYAILNISQPYRPPRPVAEIAVLCSVKQTFESFFIH